MKNILKRIINEIKKIEKCKNTAFCAGEESASEN